MDLFLMRHGKAGVRTPSPSDTERALTAAGAREVKKSASGLRRAGISFDYVASSPLPRAAQTAEIVAAAAAGRASPSSKGAPSGGRKGGRRKKGAAAAAPEVHLWDELKPEASAGSALARIAGLAFDSSVLLVGHEPGMTLLASGLVAGGGGGGRVQGRYYRDQFRPPARGAPAVAAPISINFKKGGMARLRILSTVPDVRGELRWLATPRHLGCLE